MIDSWRFENFRHPEDGFGNVFRDACDAAGVTKSAHGVRKIGAHPSRQQWRDRRGVEEIFGWNGGRMASLYTRAADRARLAKGAMAKLDRTPGEQTIHEPAFRPERQMISVCYSMVRTAGLEPALSRMRSRFSYHLGFRRHRGVFVVWTIPSPWPKSCRRRPSSLYTFLSRGLARDWRWLLPLAFPDFERFYSRRFRWGTPI